MARGKHILTLRCAEDGCNQTTMYAYGTNKEYSDAYRRIGSVPWHCLRHDPNGKNIKEFGEKVITEHFFAERSEYTQLREPFWNKTKGFIYGDGWNAYAKDFPMGTTITVETKITVSAPDDYEESE